MCADTHGEPLSGLDLGDTFTDVPGGTAHWIIGNEGGNYSDASGGVDIVIHSASHMLSYTADVHGSISGSVSQTVADGATGNAVTAVADSSYHFTD